MSGTSHSVVAALRWARAPEEAVAWAEREPFGSRSPIALEDALHETLDAAPSNRAALWLLAAIGVESDVLATAVAMLLEARLAHMEEPRLSTALEVALGALVDGALGERALVQAKLCELLATSPRAKEEGGYRTHQGRYSAVCRAVGIFSRAAEAIGAFGARMEAERMARARRSANLVGIGVNATVHERPRPATLATPLDVNLPPPHELIFATEHLVLALGELEAFEPPKSIRDELLEQLAED